ncbi:MAG: hypothetical protein FJ096_20435 [Deltaproteobacteria bacterium]|nr:hypothetical protein [Deltaproteobacteria bacterium]
MRLTSIATLIVCLAPLVACAPPKLGVLKVTGSPDDALITVDDQYVGKLARLRQHGIKVNAGEHRVSVEAAGRFPQDELVTVPPEGEARLDVKLDPIPE